MSTDEPDLSGLEPRLRDLVGRALRKRPEQRPTARELLLALVGDGADPVLATTRILDAADWTLPDTSHDAAPNRGRPRRIPYRLLALAAVAVAALVTTLVLLPGRDTPGNNGAQPGGTPARTGTAGTVTPAARASSGGSPASSGGSSADSGGSSADSGESPAGTGRGTSLDVRVPETGTAALGVGEVHRYGLALAVGGRVYLQGVAEDCGAHLLPWTLVRRGGDTVAGANLTCERYGPLQLAAGEYELRIGGPGVEGRYALRLIRA